MYEAGESSTVLSFLTYKFILFDLANDIPALFFSTNSLSVYDLFVFDVFAIASSQKEENRSALGIWKEGALALVCIYTILREK